MNHQADLKAYYDEEARLQTRTALRGPRVELRNEFIALLEAEGRTSVVDFGSGPGLDGAGFIEAGLRYLGVDLAPANGALAAERGIPVVPGSIAAPPLRPGSFAAGWSMSTLMHLPETEAAGAVAAMAPVLEPGAPFTIGLWGGELGMHIDDTAIAGQRRLFSLRSVELNRSILETAGAIESQQIWPSGPDGWNYQVFQLRMSGS